MTSFPNPEERYFSAICRSNGLVLGRTRATIGCRFPLLRRVSALFQSVAVVAFGDVIAAVSSLGSEVLRLAIEATRTLKPLASRIFVRGQRTILNLGRIPTASGKLPFSRFLRALDVCQDPRRDGTDLLHYNQTLSSVPTNHAHKKAWSNEHVAHEKSVKGA